MSDYKQCSDAAQTGPGTNTTGFTLKPSQLSGGLGTSGNTTSGTSQEAKRGKQGNG